MKTCRNTHDWTDGWRDIASYDRLKHKPRLAVFYFPAVTNSSHPSNNLRATVQLQRVFGNRVCTKWMPLPDPEEVEP